MASTVTISHHFKSFKVGTVNLGTYATNGVAITGAQVDCPTQMYTLLVLPSAGYVFEYVPSTGKIKAYWSAASGNAMSEVTNSTDLSSLNPQFIALGF